jgi:cytochrome c oxidase subunit 2
MKRVGLKLAALGGTLTALSGAAWAEGYGRPLDVSLDGHRSDFLFQITTVAIVILFALMVGVIAWASLMHRERPGHKALYDHGMAKKQLLLTAVIGGILFFGVDGTALVHSATDLSEGFWKWPTAAENPVNIEVYAQQWAWNIRYAGPDGKFNTADDVVTLNDMHIPVDRPVYVKMKSKDVIHSFYLPNFRIKQDAFPAAVSRLWFEAKQTGKFDIGCAQHCGVSHYKMHGALTVTSAKDFDEWMNAESATAKRRFDEADTDAHWGWDWEI